VTAGRREAHPWGLSSHDYRCGVGGIRCADMYRIRNADVDGIRSADVDGIRSADVDGSKGGFGG